MHYAIIVALTLLVMLLIAKGAQARSAIPISEIERQIFIYAKANGIEPAIVKAVVKVESNFNPRALNPASAPGVAVSSYGLMQITAALAYDYGIVSNWQSPSTQDIEKMYDVYNNLSVGCGFLSSLLSKYSFDQAIQSYNVGERGYWLGRRNYSYLDKVRSQYEHYK